MLSGFDGTILFVAHDRYFIDKIATRIWAVEDGTLKTYLGNYSDYQRQMGRRLEATKSETAAKIAVSAAAAEPLASPLSSVSSNDRQPPAAVERNSNRAEAASSPRTSSGGQEPKPLDNRAKRELQRQLQQAEQAISKLEAKLNELSEAMAIAGVEGDSDALARLGTEYERSQRELDDAYALWEEINLKLAPALVE
jgi:ATP-binding cassette subfamily F protein 3